MICIVGVADPNATELKELFKFIKANKAEELITGDLKGAETAARMFGQILDIEVKRFSTDWNTENALTKRNEAMLKVLFEKENPKIAVVGTNLTSMAERLLLKALLAGAEHIKIGESNGG